MPLDDPARGFDRVELGRRVEQHWEVIRSIGPDGSGAAARRLGFLPEGVPTPVPGWINLNAEQEGQARRRLHPNNSRDGWR